MNKTCAFLGNDYDFVWRKRRTHNTPDNLKEQIREQIINLIENEGVSNFLVGELGGYEVDAYDTVLEVQQTYPDIRITLVISKISELHDIGEDSSGVINHKRGCDDWVYPPKCELGYKRLCIVYRNRYIIENTDFIIAYNPRHGRAYEFCKQAKGKGVRVIELSEMS